MVWIHIGVYLEYKSAEIRIFGFYGDTFGCYDGTRRRGYFHKAVKQFFDTECIECRAKEYRRHLACQIKFAVEVRVYALYQDQVFA